ncbi:MAG: ribosome small subunit-dependent GTPase A [Deltaproteobacteria bacterium]|nr:MAG: ribosome small subunit-dependent GTPase A [Deltaproteobacteria bacterium]PIE72355.1 MAG: ribosome small subunit-dependent GTPase A [Deltaproteobacteria bacterium]
MDMDGRQEEGIISAHYGVAVDVRFTKDRARVAMVRVKRNSGHVVGDRVIVQKGLLQRLERKSELLRMDARGGVHVVAANLDVVCIVIACEPLPPPGFVDRAVVAARASQLRPLLIVNKADLGCFTTYSADLEAVYGGAVDIFAVSAITGENLQMIKDFFSRGHRGVFVGPTGVGKSSILNALVPDIALVTAEISASKKRGRNTTTVSTLHHLPEGGELVDSPGFNDFGLVEVSAADLALFFPGFEEAIEHPCRFRDCSHRSEPGCSVVEAVASGTISPERYQAYLQIRTERDSLILEPKYREKRNRRKK